MQAKMILAPPPADVEPTAVVLVLVDRDTYPPTWASAGWATELEERQSDERFLTEEVK